MNVSKLEIVPVRQAFTHEAHKFTVWMENNIGALSERIGFKLTVLEREKSVGSFNVDLLCESDQGERIIIENQLEQSDHDHLGKLLTYLVNLDAKMAIWITPEVRPEHQRVIDWLNQSTSEDFSFYLVRIEAVRIGDSPYAPLFTVLAGPDEQTDKIGETKKELAERHHERLRFWTEFIDRSRSRTQLYANRSPSTDHWLTAGIGKSGIQLNGLIFKDRAAVDIYIDIGNFEKNKLVFDSLLNQKDTIENEIGYPLEWRRLDDKRASRIIRFIEGEGSLNEPEKWARLQEIMIDSAMRFDKAFRNRLSAIKI